VDCRIGVRKTRARTFQTVLLEQYYVGHNSALQIPVVQVRRGGSGTRQNMRLCRFVPANSIGRLCGEYTCGEHYLRHSRRTTLRDDVQLRILYASLRQIPRFEVLSVRQNYAPSHHTRAGVRQANMTHYPVPFVSGPKIRENPYRYNSDCFMAGLEWSVACLECRETSAECVILSAFQ
jgi:hypothetical protein